MVNKWDKYFHGVCVAVGEKSACLSRQIGAILVKDRSIIATAYNGPPTGIPHCDSWERRNFLHTEYGEEIFKEEWVNTKLDVCPRRLMGFGSGLGLEFCTAAHSERNLLIQCAYLGISTKDCVIYMNNPVLPCRECFLELIQARIKEVVNLQSDTPYNDIRWLLNSSRLKIREFYLGELDVPRPPPSADIRK